MKSRDMANSWAANLNTYLLTLVVIWTAGIIASLGWNVHQLRQSILRIARTSAEISYNKDLIYRRWVAKQGGVYVPVSEMTPANPYLHVPNRDVVTSDGLLLTLVNPAYMTRQVNELAIELNNLQGHITSLNPIRPENHPDTWEAEVLKTFEQGIKETGAIEIASGKEYFRMMYPFVTEKACLRCHAAQGYKEGDIRGGISVSIPMEPLRVVERSRTTELMLAHSFLWVIGLVGIGVATRRLQGQALVQEKLEEDLRSLSITDSLTSLHNRRGFISLAEQQMKLSDRTKRKLILFFADLDGLKKINDMLGHEEGNKSLVEAASAFRETFRASDIIARMGGDEFAILAIDPEGSTAEILHNRLQNQIDKENNKENRKYRLSVSVGHASYDPENPCSLDELMLRADQQMYEQKNFKKGLFLQGASPSISNPYPSMPDESKDREVLR